MDTSNSVRCVRHESKGEIVSTRILSYKGARSEVMDTYTDRSLSH